MFRAGKRETGRRETGDRRERDGETEGAGGTRETRSWVRESVREREKTAEVPAL